MKRLYIFAICLCVFSINSIQSQCGNLYIGGVIDGPLTGGTPKAIQVCASADIADLSIYGVGSANNGGGSDGEEFTFPAEAISSGECFWVASETTEFNNWFGFNPCFTSAAANINGDDAIELFCSGSVEDLFGDINVDGSLQCWDNMDGWAKNALTANNGGTFSCGNYTFSGINALDGETSNATATTPYPSPTQTCPSIAPVKLKDFNVSLYNKNQVRISWETTIEENNDFFEVQHSTDGINFEGISHVKGSGNTSFQQEYEFIHDQPIPGKNYYRLKQVDYDGLYEIFAPKAIVLNTRRYHTVYPTISSSIIHIESFGDLIDQPVDILIVDQNGKSVYKITKELKELEEINIFDLKSGHYFLLINYNGEVETMRFIKP